MDEAEHCDRIAIVDRAHRRRDTRRLRAGSERTGPATPTTSPGHGRGDRGLEAAVHEGAVTFAVAEGAAFVPQLFAGLDVPINSVTVTRPSLDDVFLAYTGKTIRDAEAARPMSPMAFAARGR